jgi:Type I phosphodiesterase / nucleotide pyrophosphatase
VRYLRTLSNALVAAGLGTCYVLVLFLQLNPGLPVDPLRLLPLVTSVGLFYAVHFTAAFYVMLVFRQLVARTLFSPAWISVTVQAWLGALAAAVGSTLMWTNLRTFGIVLPVETAAAMTNGALVLALSAALFAAAALGRRGTGTRGRWGWAAVVTIIAGLSVAVPLVLRGPGRLLPLEARPLDAMLDMPAVGLERVPRVTIIAIDGGSLDLITSATAEGRLPNFGRMLDAGAVLRLATLHPTSAEAVWSAVATGKLPQKNGVRSAGIYHLANAVETLRLLPDYCFANRLMRFGFLLEEPHTSAAIRTRPFWSILSLQGVTVGVLNWPLTYPAPVVRGYVVSNMYSRLALTTSAFDDPSMLYPPDLGEEALPIMQMAAGDPEAVVPVHARNPLAERHQLPGRTDVIYDRLARTLASTRPTQVTAIRYQSLDAIGHFFLRYAEPSSFGDVTDAERADLGQVLESHYAQIDEAIGRAISALGPGDLLLVVSGFGMEPLSFGKRLLERVIGDRDISGTHETAPDGFLMAYGASVAQGRLRRASVVDVVPTLLYFLGLPIGRDMDGYARTDLFQASFTEERPMTFIPTYDR